MTKNELTPAELVEDITANGFASLSADVTNGRRRTGLVSLDERGAASELVRDQYSGRYPLELIQNANDALAAEGATGRRVRLVLTNTALLGADQGAGFGIDEINAICGLARSSKDPRKSVGYKGLGFKSVREITDTPQIISQHTRFGFDAARLRQAIEGIAGPLEDGFPDFRVPDYAFPFTLSDADLGADADAIERLQAEGFRTVFRLPFRDKSYALAVAERLASTVLPRLLLFLDATESLELVGTNADFAATAVRESHSDHDELLLEIGEKTEHFLLFRREVPIEPRSLVAELGPAWREVQAVRIAVAIPLDAHGRPSAKSTQPVHIYFPTEEETGFALIINADFQVELDRRRISKSVHAEAYNQWLLDEVVAFVADTVAPALAKRFDGVDVLAMLAVRADPSGFGHDLSKALYRALRGVAVVPCKDGQLRTPDEVELLPPTVADAETLHAWLPSLAELVIAQAESNKPVRKLLLGPLGVSELSTRVVLHALEPPAPEDVERYYDTLVSWSRTSVLFASDLKRARCVRLKDGSWVRPVDAAFFPQQREEVEFPIDLGIPVVDIPDNDALFKLLTAAGVRQARWRDLIPQFLVPRLSDPNENQPAREAALTALRRYYDSTRRGDAGDHEIRDALPQILFPSRTASSSSEVGELRVVDHLYFGADWLPDARLEELYGPFGKSDFVALRPPIDRDQQEADRKFYGWLGIADRPRIVQVGEWDPDYSSWRQMDQTQRAGQCTSDTGHPQSQRLDSAPSIDRLVPLIRSEDHDRLSVLWRLLAKHWSDYEHDVLEAHWRCIASAPHRCERTRRFPSPGSHVLRTAKWVPAERGDGVTFERPDHVWRTAPGMPGVVASVVRKPAGGIHIPAGMGERLGMVDGARPSANQIIELLEDLDDRHSGDEALSSAVVDAALWLLRKLDEVVTNTGDSLLPGSVPLVALVQGEPHFHRRPYLVRSAMLREAWADALPLYGGDADLRTLLARLDLPVLDDQIVVDALAGDPLLDFEDMVRTRLSDTAPALMVVASREAPSRNAEIATKIKRLLPHCSAELQLQYTLTGHQPRVRDDATAFISSVGEVYLRIDSGAPDWWALGLRLAEIINVRTGDAFAILLSGDEATRKGYFNAHRVTEAALGEAAGRIAEAAKQPGDGASDTHRPDATAEEAVASKTRAETTDVGDETVPQESAEGLQPTTPARTGELASGSDDGLAGTITSDTAAEESPALGSGTGPAGVEASSIGPPPSTGSRPSDTATSITPTGNGPSDRSGTGGIGAAAPTASGMQEPEPNGDTGEPQGATKEEMMRFYSFVTVRCSEHAASIERDESSAMALGIKGVEHVLAFERAAGRGPVEQHHANRGFDVISEAPDGSDRRVIEVKATDGAWPERGIPVSRHQVARNLADGDAFWLYVVEHASDPIRARVIPIQNPVASIDYYVFDHGWEHLGRTRPVD